MNIDPEYYQPKREREVIYMDPFPEEEEDTLQEIIDQEVRKLTF